MTHAFELKVEEDRDANNGDKADNELGRTETAGVWLLSSVVVPAINLNMIVLALIPA